MVVPVGGTQASYQWEWGPGTVRKFVSFIAFAVAAVGLVAVPAPAQAAPVVWSYAASTGGTYIKVADGMIQSDLTAQSSVTGGASSSTSKNSTAAAKVAGLAEVGAIETKTDATVAKTLSGTTPTLKSWARTAHLSLLNGLITADAVETTITTTGRPDGSASHTATSRLAGIHIVGINLPLNIPKNYAVTIPGVATVTMNYSMHGKVDRLAATMGWALSVTLLQPRAGYSAGVTILVNPVNQYLSEVDPATGAKVSGTAYGTRIQANAGDTVNVVSDPTARVGTPVGSSNGRTLSNSTLGVRVPRVLTTGVVTSTTTSNQDAFGNAEITNTNQTAGVNLLGGLITAKAIKVTAHSKLQDGKWTHQEKLELVELVVAGQRIPVDVSPNTIINVAGLGRVAINEQRSISNGSYQTLIYGVRITLDTEQAGLPIGAQIELGAAYTGILP